MEKSHNRILILGVGAIGGLISYHLSYDKSELTIVTNSQISSDILKAEGITVVNRPKIIKNNLKIFTKISDIPRKDQFDIIICAMKAYSLKQAMIESKDLLSKNGYFVCIQNGIINNEIKDFIDEKLVIRGITRFGGKVISPGIYEQNTKGDLYLGEYDGQISDRLKSLDRIFKPYLSIKLSDNIIGVIWTKLAINCTLNALNTVLGIKIGQLFENSFYRYIMFKLYSEVIDLGFLLGVKFENLGFNPFLFYWNENDSKFKHFIIDNISKLLRYRYRNSKASTLQSIENKKPTEIDYLNGYISYQSKNLDFKTPYNDISFRIIKSIEKGDLNPNLENLKFYKQYLDGFS